MKYVLATLGANLVALVCVVGAIYLALQNRDGWGWFLFVGLCCAKSIEIGGGTEKPEEP